MNINIGDTYQNISGKRIQFPLRLSNEIEYNNHYCNFYKKHGNKT